MQLLSDVERAALAWLWSAIDPEDAERAFGVPGLVAPAEPFGAWRNQRYWLDLVQRARKDRLSIREIVRDQDGAILLLCPDARQRETMVRVLLSRDGAVRELTHGRQCPPGFHTRLGGPSEWDAIAELIRDAPVVTGDRSFSIWYRRLGDVAAMQDRAQAALAVRDSDGALAAARISSTRQAMEQESQFCFGVAFQAAVHPSARGQGLERCVLDVVNRSLIPVVDDFHGYVDAGNAAIMQAMGDPPHWTHPARQIAIPVEGRQVAGPGRTATPEDAARVLELLIGAHGREVLRPPYSIEWLARRFGTISAYRWDSIQLADRAMLALWLPGDEIVDLAPGRTRRMRVGYIADFGFVGADGLRDLLRLIDAARAHAASMGMTHLIAYTSAGSPGADALSSRAEYDDEMLVIWNRPEPPSITESGVYTDPFYA